MTGQSRTYSNVTAATLQCLRSRAQAYGITLPEGDDGTFAASYGPMDVAGSFHYDPAAGTLTVQVTKKPFFVSDDQIAGALDPIVTACGGRPPTS